MYIWAEVGITREAIVDEAEELYDPRTGFASSEEVAESLVRRFGLMKQLRRSKWVPISLLDYVDRILEEDW